MSASSTLSADGKTCCVRITGRFDFSMHRDFREAYESCEGTPEVYDLDLSSTEYMDSSALGMLLVMKEFAESKKSTLRIGSVNDEIMQLLKIANYDKLFDMA